MTLTEHQANWLSMIRYQVLVAHQQASAPAPLSSLALNSMQDAVESMLKLCAEALPIASSDIFDRNLDAVVKASNQADHLDGYASSLKAMNKARVSFKHYGNTAHDSNVRKHMDAADAAVRTFVESIFGINLERVSLLLLVSNTSVRARIDAAQKLRAKGEHGEAAADLAQAFHELLGEYESKKSTWYRSIYSTKPPFVPSMPRHDDPLRLAYEWLEAVDEQLRVLLMGVDPQGYTFFRAHMPTLMHFDGGGFGANFNGDISALSDDAWNRCLRFVIETSLRFDANDFDIPERVGNGNTFLRRNAEESDLAIGDTPDRAS